MSVVDHALALLLGIALPAVAAVSARRRSTQAWETSDKIILYWLNAANLWFLALLVAGAWVLQGRKLADLGLVMPAMGGAAAAVTLAALLGVGVDTWRQLHHPSRLERTRARWRRDTPFLAANRIELAHYLVLAVSAAICEEVLFRGFLIRYLESVLGGGVATLPLAITLPALAFGISHLYQGLWHAAKIMVSGVALGVLFVLTSSLLVPMILHAGVDIVMGVVGVRLLTPAIDEGAKGAC